MSPTRGQVSLMYLLRVGKFLNGVRCKACCAVSTYKQGCTAGAVSSDAASDNANVVGAGEHVVGAHETLIQVEELQKGLCGVSRPHFFRGVATVSL